MDLITYVPNLKLLIGEAIAIQSEQDNPLSRYFTVNGDDVTFNVAKVPVVYGDDDKTLCLTRGISREILNLSSSIKVIGEYINGEYVFDEGGQSIYESVYDTTSRMINDGDGGTIEYTPPYKIGVFA